MNIMVCVKQVPDNAVAPKLNAQGSAVVKEGVEMMISPFDQNAIEAALQLTEAHGGEVSVITMGDENAKGVLKTGLAMGAQSAYLVSDPGFEGSDAWATSYILAKAIQSIGQFDLILCGKQAIDGDTAQVGAGIAEQLDVPHLSYVDEIREVQPDSLTAKRVGSGGEEVVQMKLPGLLTCEKSLNEPRYPTLKRTRMANRTEIPVLDCAAIGAQANKVGQAGSPTSIKKLYTPPPRQSGEVLTGEADQIAKEAVEKILALKVV